MNRSPSGSFLRKGDIFEAHGPAALSADSAIPAYIVLGLNRLAMQVAEIGGQNRDEIEVSVCGGPSALGIHKWQMRCEAGGTTDGYLKSKLPQLRRHLTNFRYADRIGAHTNLCASNFSGPVDAVGIFNHVDSPLFYQSQYLFLENGGVLPSMRLFDLGLMGVIPETRITRNENGSAATYDVGIDDCVTPAQRLAADDFATRYDLLMHTDMYVRARLFSTNKYEGLDRIEGFFKDDSGVAPRVFSQLKEAHSAVLDFRSGLGK